MSHWSLLLVAPLLAYWSPWFGGISLTCHYLLLPLAAHLGKRYGLTGVIAIAVGGLVFVINVSGSGWGGFGGNPALYLVALAVAALTASERPLSDWLRWPGAGAAANRVAFAAPFLLVFSLYTGYMEPAARGTDLRLSFGIFLSPLGYFVLFLMGARGVRYWPPVLGLVAAAAVTWALAAGGLPARAAPAAFHVWINPLQPVAALAALVAFSAGAALGRFLQGRPAAGIWKRPYLTAAVLLFVWYGPETISNLGVTIGTARGISLLKSPVLLPLAALTLGLLRGARGVIFATAAAPAAIVLGVAVNALAAAAFGLNQPGTPSVPLEAPFVALAYALLGARIAEQRGQPLAFPMLRPPGYILVVLGAAAAIAGVGDSPWRLALAGGFLLAAVAGAIAWSRLRRAMSGTPFEITPERWLAFTTLACLAVSLCANLQAAGGSLRQLAVLLLPLQALFDASAAARLRAMAGEAVSVELLALFALLGLAYVAGLLQPLRGLARSVPKVLGDLRRMAAYVKASRSGGAPKRG